MLTITIPASEYYNQKEDKFYTNKKPQTITLEHSLVSISKWEAKWHKPFLSEGPKTLEESIDYVRCMTLTQNVNPETYNFLSKDNFAEINNYIQDPMTASTVSDKGNKRASREIVTSELIYYWMIALTIPMKCEKWHLNRLLMLIRICEAKQEKPKKMSKGDIMRSNRSLNAARRKASGSRG